MPQPLTTTFHATSLSLLAWPLICISLIGLALLPFVPLAVVLTLVFILTINATGAVGDLYIVGVLLTSPPSTLIRDFGDGMTFYRPSRTTIR